MVAGVRRALELLCHLSPKQMAVTGEKSKQKSVDEDCLRTAFKLLQDFSKNAKRLLKDRSKTACTMLLLIDCLKTPQSLHKESTKTPQRLIKDS